MIVSKNPQNLNKKHPFPKKSCVSNVWRIRVGFNRAFMIRDPFENKVKELQHEKPGCRSHQKMTPAASAAKSRQWNMPRAFALDQLTERQFFRPTQFCIWK